MNIVFLCPPATVINGGTKYLYKMGEVLAAQGHEVQMFEQEGRRPTWFPTKLPVVGQGVLRPRADQAFILPEDQPKLLDSVRTWPQRKVIYAQNHFYAALGVGEAESYADYGVTHILCSSQAIYAYAQLRHPKLKPYVIPCAIDTGLFKPGLKQKRIAYMPRKRGIEASYLRDMFRHLYPEYRNWAWDSIHDQAETETARRLGEAQLFLSLSRLEGFGLTPLEAMAAGCVVAGFTGIGGREYANDSNGFWANEDDFPACLAALKQAVDLASAAPSDSTTAYRSAAAATLARYTDATFKENVLKAASEIFL